MPEKPPENNNKNAEKPPLSPLLAGILGNAIQSSVPMQSHAAGVETRKCNSCGAARPAETNLQYCDYCGHQFY